MKKSGNAKIYIEMLLLKFINDYIFNKINENIIVEKNISTSNSLNITLIYYIFSDSKKSTVFNNELITRTEVNKSHLNPDISMNSTGNAEVEKIEVEKKVNPIKNIVEIMKIRANNTLVKADKNLLKDELVLFNQLNDYIYDSEHGYSVTLLIDSKIRAVSSESIILSFDFDSSVESSYLVFEDLCNTYNKITNSNKKIAIISSNDWDKLKDDYITKFKNKESLDYLKEPDPVFEELNNDDIIVSSAVELFGDIVEID